MRGHNYDSILIPSKDTHVLVSPEIMGRQGTHLVEDMAQETANFLLHVDLLLKEVELVHPGVHTHVIRGIGNRIELFKLRDENLMDLLSQVLFHCAADRRSHILGESFVDFLLVVIDCGR